MKISKISQGLVLIPLTGLISLMGTSAAFASECSTLSPCVTTAVSSLPALTGSTVQVAAPPVQPVPAPISSAAQNAPAPVTTVTTPVAGAVNKVTSPAANAVKNVAAPVAPVASPLQEHISAIPAAPVAVEQPASSVVPSPAPAAVNTEIVTPPDTKSASNTSVPALHDSSAAASGGLTGSTTLTPRLLDFQPTAVHSSQGDMTKVVDSGAFGFGHLNPVDDPVGFTSLVFAYITVLGSAIGFAVKKSAFLNFGKLI